MPHNDSNPGRRRFIKLGLLGIAAVPLGNLLLHKVTPAQAQDMAKLEESDPQAQALNYVNDATQAEARQEGHFCDNCQLYQGDPEAEWGPCAIFPGKQVNAKGWCSAYIVKAG